MARRLVVGLFESSKAAQAAVNLVVHGGCPPGSISVVARDEVFEQALPGGGAGGGRPDDRGESDPAEGKRPSPEEAARHEGIVALAVPGMGHLLEAGPLFVSPGDGATGTRASQDRDALARTLIEHGLDDAAAHACAEAVRDGQVLVAVEAGGASAAAADAAMRQAGARETLAAPAR
jgi:hypothetical protein